MIELEKIPHIHEISNHGPYHGAREKNTATFQARSTRQNKLVPSLEEAIRRTGLKDGMTISFHHHFRNGDPPQMTRDRQWLPFTRCAQSKSLVFR